MREAAKEGGGVEEDASDSSAESSSLPIKTGSSGSPLACGPSAASVVSEPVGGRGVEVCKPCDPSNADRDEADESPSAATSDEPQGNRDDALGKEERRENEAEDEEAEEPEIKRRRLEFLSTMKHMEDSGLLTDKGIGAGMVK
eukprot:GHVT01008899.1.p3 GENE.GHVT01008899.1~~GHVT01008899.1.p3  ORF type:complete len:143 (-),score=44.23 GHVT01008899.1:352-780(-)